MVPALLQFRWPGQLKELVSPSPRLSHLQSVSTPFWQVGEHEYSSGPGYTHSPFSSQSTAVHMPLLNWLQAMRQQWPLPSTPQIPEAHCEEPSVQAPWPGWLGAQIPIVSSPIEPPLQKSPWTQSLSCMQRSPVGDVGWHTPKSSRQWYPSAQLLGKSQKVTQEN
jgi:hypothetical protein